MHHVKEVLIILSITLILSLSVYGLGGGESSESEEGSGGIVVYPDPMQFPEDNGAIYSAVTESQEASLVVQNVEEPLGVSSYTGNLQGDGWGASATY